MEFYHESQRNQRSEAMLYAQKQSWTLLDLRITSNILYLPSKMVSHWDFLNQTCIYWHINCSASWIQVA